MMGCQYCDNQHEYITNSHKGNAPIKGFVFTSDEQYVLIILIKGCTEAVFDINYCPMCGKKLEE